MKQILYILAIATVLYSCSKKSPEVTLPESISFKRAWDSTKLEYRTFYHVVLNRKGSAVDSSVCLMFVSPDSIFEYKTSTDTNGLHLNDSSKYRWGNTYSEYMKTDPNYYSSSIGYVFTKFMPLGGSASSFPFYDNMVTDTLVWRIGTPVKYNRVSGSFNRKGTDTVTTITLYK